MSTHRVCQYTTQPSETRLSALKRRKDHVEQQLQDIQRSHLLLLQLLHAISISADADVATISQQLRQGHDPALILQQMEDGRLMLQLSQPADAIQQGSAAVAPGLADQRRASKVPQTAHSKGANQKAHGELLSCLQFAEQEEGVEILHRLHQG